ncbi:MAG: helix-turn-helix transcriptional regulator [Hyphomicrobiales bacterium]
MIITPEQCRGARGMLDWSQAKLAKEARLGLSTVRDFEKGRRMPLIPSMLALVAALEGAGITFTVPDEGAVGVVLKR